MYPTQKGLNNTKIGNLDLNLFKYKFNNCDKRQSLSIIKRVYEHNQNAHVLTVIL